METKIVISQETKRRLMKHMDATQSFDEAINAILDRLDAGYEGGKIMEKVIVITEADITKKMVFDGQCLTIDQCTTDGKLHGDIYITYTPDIGILAPSKFKLSIPVEFAQFISDTLAQYEVKP